MLSVSVNILVKSSGTLQTYKDGILVQEESILAGDSFPVDYKINLNTFMVIIDNDTVLTVVFVGCKLEELLSQGSIVISHNTAQKQGLEVLDNETTQDNVYPVSPPYELWSCLWDWYQVN